MLQPELIPSKATLKTQNPIRAKPYSLSERKVVGLASTDGVTREIEDIGMSKATVVGAYLR